VGGDEVDVPPVDVGRAGLNDVPRLLDELNQVLLGLGDRDLVELALHVDLLPLKLNDAAHQ